ncbi:phage holin family protein [Qipengyuania thermophila]|uniref:phage holin family protein n=1 Tax=Qipengyuania thermophila TaxID=2509361 RepID=UPI001F17A500|nr:phage holin family protein [Qipengyuania thermophila]
MGDDGEMPDADSDISLIENVTALYHDGRDYLTHELAYQKTRAAYAGKSVGSIAGLGVAAGVVALLAAIGLTVGAILSLATLIGPLAATLVVVVALLVVAAVLGMMARSKAMTMVRVLKGEDE